MRPPATCRASCPSDERRPPGRCRSVAPLTAPCSDERIRARCRSRPRWRRVASPIDMSDRGRCADPRRTVGSTGAASVCDAPSTAPRDAHHRANRRRGRVDGADRRQRRKPSDREAEETRASTVRTTQAAIPVVDVLLPSHGRAPRRTSRRRGGAAAHRSGQRVVERRRRDRRSGSYSRRGRRRSRARTRRPSRPSRGSAPRTLPMRAQLPARHSGRTSAVVPAAFAAISTISRWVTVVGFGTCQARPMLRALPRA